LSIAIPDGLLIKLLQGSIDFSGKKQWSGFKENWYIWGMGG
jgi:hypothetical protein